MDDHNPAMPFERSSYPSIFPISLAIAPTIETFTIVDGIKGPIRSPEHIRARDCPLKVGGARLMTFNAIRSRRPLFETATLIPMAEIRSHTVVPEKLAKAVEKGMIPKRTQAEHMTNIHTKSGMIFVIQFIMAHARSPNTHMAGCPRFAGAGYRLIKRPVTTAAAS